jgi:hypothetical protein
MTDLDPLAKMLHDAFWRVTGRMTWQAADSVEMDRWRRVAKLVDTMAVPAPPPPADLALRQWAIGLVYGNGVRYDMEPAIQRLIALALGQPAADRLKP